MSRLLTGVCVGFVIGYYIGKRNPKEIVLESPHITVTQNYSEPFTSSSSGDYRVMVDYSGGY